LPYWGLFLLPLTGLFAPDRTSDSAQRIGWVVLWLLLTLAIGLWHQVGGDWGSYLGYLARADFLNLGPLLALGDPGYQLLNWVVAQLGGSIYWVNLVCGGVVMAGVVRFARRQPWPVLALVVAVPYLIIVVSMGYTRQAAALGFILLGLVALGDGRLRTFAAWVLIAAAFHKSAVLLLPVAALAASQHRVWNLFWVGVITLIGGYLFLFDSVDTLWENYVEADYQSQGGLIRVLMNAVPAALFLVFRKRMALGEEERRLWWWLSVLALVCIPLVAASSTATDRVALYLIPLQLYVFARLPGITRDPALQKLIIVSVVGYYALVQFVWLNFATHAFAWLPYQFAWFV
jgi:hypothetical protein